MNQLSRLAFVIALSLLARAAVAQQQDQRPTRISGIVLGIESRVRFVVVDKSGTQVPVSLTIPVTFTLNDQSVNFDDVVKPGNIVRCMLDDEGRVNQIIFRGQASQLDTNQMRPFMGLNDAEWQVISARIDHIRQLQRAVEGRSTSSSNNNSGEAPAENPIRTQMKALQSAFWDQHQSSTDIESGLRNLRELKARARADLEKARQELTELVTPRQEILLVLQGILD
jgi:hypothetical protein